MSTTALAPVLSEITRSGQNGFDMSGLDTETAERYQAARDSLNAEAAECCDDPEWIREQAAVISQEITYGFRYESLFRTYFDTRNVGEFDQFVIRERKGLRVFWTHRGGYIEESQLEADGFELPRDTLGFHVSEFRDKIRSNDAANLESLLPYGKIKMEAELNRRLFQTLQEAIPTGSDYFDDASATGLTPEVLNAAISGVEDAPRPDGVRPAPVTIIGRAAAVDQISDFSGYGNETLEEIRKKGRLGVYRGANIVRLRNITDETGEAFIPDNEVWVFSGDVGTAALYGGAETWGWMENSVRYLHLVSRQDAGVAVYRPQLARRILVG